MSGVVVLKLTGSHHGPFPWALALSAAVHAVLFAAALGFGGWAKPPFAAGTVYTIRLEGEDFYRAPGRSDRQAEVKGEEKEEVMEEELEEVEEEEPLPIKEDNIVEERKEEESVAPAPPVPRKEEEKKPEVKRKKTESPLEKTAVREPEGEVKKTGGSGGDRSRGTGVPGISFGGASFRGVDAEVFPFTYYLESILRRIGSRWVKPGLSSYMDSSQKTVVYFKILRDGEVDEIRVEERSGSSLFDRACLKAIERASPLPPLPGGFREEDLGVHLEFLP